MKKIDVTKLLTVMDYARKKGVSHQAVYQAIERGSLTPIVIGGKKFLQDDE